MQITDITVKVPSGTTEVRILDQWVEEARRHHLQVARRALQRLPLEGVEGQWTIGIASVAGVDYVLYVFMEDVIAHPTKPRTVRARIATWADYVYFCPVASDVQIQFTLNSPISDDEATLLMDAFKRWFGQLTPDRVAWINLGMDRYDRTTQIDIRVDEKLLSGEAIALRARNLIASTLTDSPRSFGAYMHFVATTLLFSRHWPPRTIKVTGGLLR